MKKGIIFILVLMFTVSWAFAEKGAPIQYDPADYPAPTRQGGETVDDATVIGALPYNDAGTTVGYVDDYDEECPYTGSTSPDVVYSYTPTVDVINGFITLCGDTDYDSKLYIYENTVTPGTPFACVDDACVSALGQSYVSEITDLTFVGGNTYYIVVDGYGGASGNYEIDVTGDMSVYGTIEGTVTLDGGAGNVEEAVVSAGGETTNPAIDGTYSLEVMVGTYDVTATLAGYESDLVEDVVVTEGNITSGVDLTLTYVPATLDPIVNLAVDASTGLLTWLAPGSGGVDELTEDFEGGTLPDGWLAIDDDGDGFNWINIIETGFGFDAYEGDGAMTSASYDNTAGALTPDNWLITPALSISNGHQLSYWHDAQDPLWADEYYYVRVSTSGTDLEDFTDVIWEGITPADWAEVVLDLSAYAGQTIYIAWNHTNITDMFWMKIDYVVVGAADRVISVSNNTQNYIQTSTNHKILGANGSVLENAIVNNQNVSSRDLLGYNVYLDTVLQGNTTDLEYLLSGLENGIEYTAGVEAVYDEGESDIVEITFTYTGGSEVGNVIVAATKLNGNYPNPFNPVTTISYSIKETGNVTLEVYNLRGQLVKALVNEVKETGNHSTIWNGTDNYNKPVSSGVYFYKMVSEGNIGRYTSTKKMILMK